MKQTFLSAAGTLGRRIVDGARGVRIFGIPVPIRADLYTINGLSAPAEQKALLAWMSHFRKPPARTSIVHDKGSVSAVFADAIRDRLGWKGVEIPTLRRSVIL